MNWNIIVGGCGKGRGEEIITTIHMYLYIYILCLHVSIKDVGYKHVDVYGFSVKLIAKKKTELLVFSVSTMIHDNRNWCYFCINIISSMWHAWHIYKKIGGFKAICPTWCDWLRRVLCSLKPLCAKRDIKKKDKKKTNEKLHLDNANCSVYVFNVLCSACFGMEWNLPKNWLVF